MKRVVLIVFYDCNTSAVIGHVRHSIGDREKLVTVYSSIKDRLNLKDAFSKLRELRSLNIKENFPHDNNKALTDIILKVDKELWSNKKVENFDYGWKKNSKPM